MYCSQLCKEDAFKQYHQIECQMDLYFQALMKTLPFNIRLTIRTFLVATKQGEDLEKLMQNSFFKNPMKKAIDPISKKFNSEDAVHLLNLTNDSLIDQSSQWKEAVVMMWSVFVMYYFLRKTPYFGTTVEKTWVRYKSVFNYISFVIFNCFCNNICFEIIFF